MNKTKIPLMEFKRGFGMSRMLNNWRSKFSKKGYKIIILNDRINDVGSWKYTKKD